MKGLAPRCGMGEEPVILALGALSLLLLVGGIALAVWAWSR